MTTTHFTGYHDLVATARAIIESPLDVTEQDVDRLQAIDDTLGAA